MSSVVNIGAIGVGAFMARQHLPNIRRNPNLRIHTLCDLNAELLEQRRREYQPLRVTDRAEEVFEDPEIDAVLIGTRGARHAVFIELAARYGKHIYVEKPMTQTYDETRRVLDALKGVDINVGVGFNRRFAPAMAEARRLFQGYKAGRPANLIYRIVDDHRVRPPYVFDMQDGGGHLLAEGCHIFDLLAWFLGEEPVEIFAAGPMETDNAVIIKYAGGSLAAMLCGGKGALFYPKELLEAFCNHRTLAVDNFFELRLDGPGGNCIRTFPPAGENKIRPDEDSMTGFYRKEFAARPPEDIAEVHMGGRSFPTPSLDKGHAQAMAEFAAAAAEGRRFSVNAVDGARATVCALKAYDSIRLSRPVAILPEEYGA